LHEGGPCDTKALAQQVEPLLCFWAPTNDHRAKSYNRLQNLLHKLHKINIIFNLDFPGSLAEICTLPHKEATAKR
jgi:hypothetical protein